MCHLTVLYEETYSINFKDLTQPNVTVCLRTLMTCGFFPMIRVCFFFPIAENPGPYLIGYTSGVLAYQL